MTESNLPQGERRYPCEAWTKSEHCDFWGGGGFMGHTCTGRVRSGLERTLDLASGRLKATQLELESAEREYGTASRALDAFNAEYTS